MLIFHGTSFLSSYPRDSIEVSIWKSDPMNLRRHVINMVSASTDSSSSNNHREPYSTNHYNIVVGLNGALQKRFVLPINQDLVPGNVHRATHVDFGVGGKGQDVAITLQCLLEGAESSDHQKDDDSNLGVSDSIRLVQFIGTGSAGDTVHNLLKDRLGERTMEFTVRSASEMRTCTSIVSTDDTTELVEPSGRISDAELEELYSVVSRNRNRQIGSGKKEAVRSLCIMGSMPPGCPEDTYARLYAQTAGPNTVCVVDSLAGTRPLLQTISIMGHGATAGPVLFKINASELCKMAGISKSSSETAGIEISELTKAIGGFLKTHVDENENEFYSSSVGVIGLAITDGKHDAYFVSIMENGSREEQSRSIPSFRVLKLPVPNLNEISSQTLYPIGAGDAVAAGTVAAWSSLVANEATKNPSASFSPIIPEIALLSLADFVERITNSCSENLLELTTVQAQALAAFTFGLACGSASCLQAENSVVDNSDVNTLFQSIINCQPEIVSINASR